MKKKKLVIGILCVAVVLIAGVLFMAKNSISFSIGNCIAADNGRYLIVMDNSPVAMHQRSGKESIFPDLDTGDKIFIVHDGVNETYPGKTGLYFVFKLSDGDISDVPEDVIAQLQELGWNLK